MSIVRIAAVVALAFVVGGCSARGPMSPVVPDSQPLAVRGKAACPTPFPGGVPLVIHDNSGLAAAELAVYFTSSVPSNLAQFQYLSSTGKMVTFANGNEATRFPLSCGKFTFPLYPGGKLWIVFGSLALKGAANGQFVAPTGWVKGTPGYDVPWDVIELSQNNPGIFANITRVDMLGLPLTMTVEPKAKDQPWSSVGEDTAKYATLLEDLVSDPPFDQTVVRVPGAGVPRVINPSHIPSFPDVFNAASFFKGGFVNKVASYYQTPPGAITYNTSYKGAYCGGNWSAGSSGSAFTFKQSGTTNSYPNSLFTSSYIFEDNPSPKYNAGTCAYLLDKIVLQELNRGVMMTASHPVTSKHDFYPKGTINNQYACVLHNYSLHYATYAFAFDDAAEQASTITNPAPTSVELTIGRVPKTLPKPRPKKQECTALY